MAAKGAGYKKLTGAEQRALAEQLAQAQVDHIERAKRREMAMVANLGQFADECRWFMANKVWLTLGYETFVEWWAGRIAPIVETLGLTPGPELAQMAIEAIQKEEEGLPAAQRNSKKAIASIVGVSEWRVRGRQDQRQRRSAAGADLENAAEVIEGELAEPASPKDSTGGAPVDGEPGATGTSAGPVDVSRLDESGTQADPGPTTSDSDAAGSAADSGASADRPEPAAPQTHRDAAALGDEDGDDAAPPSEAQPARSGHVKGADEVGSEVPPQETELADGREQPAVPGVSPPAALVPEIPSWTPTGADVVALMEELAKKYESIDIDLLGQSLTDLEMDAIGSALGRIADVVSLLALWQSREAATP